MTLSAFCALLLAAAKLVSHWMSLGLGFTAAAGGAAMADGVPTTEQTIAASKPITTRPRCPADFGRSTTCIRKTPRCRAAGPLPPHAPVASQFRRPAAPSGSWEGLVLYTPTGRED